MRKVGDGHHTSSHRLSSRPHTSHLFISIHIFTSAHLHILAARSFTSSQLFIFTASHLHILTLLTFSSYLHIFASSHLHILSPLMFTSSHLHIFSPLIFSSHLHILSPCPIRIFLSSHVLICTPSHLYIFSVALLPSCPFAVLLSSLVFSRFLSDGAGQCQRGTTKRNAFAQKTGRQMWVGASKTEAKSSCV